MEKFESSVVVCTIGDVPEGPYAFHPKSGQLSRVYQLVEDDHRAFVGGCVRVGKRNDVPKEYKWLACSVR